MSQEAKQQRLITIAAMAAALAAGDHAHDPEDVVSPEFYVGRATELFNEAEKSEARANNGDDR